MKTWSASSGGWGQWGAEMHTLNNWHKLSTEEGSRKAPTATALPLAPAIFTRFSGTLENQPPLTEAADGSALKALKSPG